MQCLQKEIEDDLVGFSIPDTVEQDDDKKDKKNKKSGGFQSMGLSEKTLKAIQKRGYKIPTGIFSREPSSITKIINSYNLQQFKEKPSLS